MANSLITGVSGLTAHQKMIEVVGHNLANLNTTGFKSRRAHFSDVFYETVKGGSGGALGAAGGANPAQIGTGAKLAGINVNHTQGNLDSTGSALDFAIDGDGFFVLDSGSGPLYTRAGVFHIDQQGFLVDSATGFLVQRHGRVGETDGNNAGIQPAGDSRIRIPLGAPVAGLPTSSASLTGNLSPTATSAQTQELRTAAPFTVGGVAATTATRLNDLDTVTTDFQAGDELSVSGTDADGGTFSATVAVDDTTTLGDLVTAVNAELSQSELSLDSTGELVLEADEPGAALLSLSLGSAAANVGDWDLSTANFVVSRSGADGARIRGAIEIFDERGAGHLIGISFERMPDETWTMTAELDPQVGTLTDPVIEGIRFAADGSFQGVTGTDSQIAVQFAGRTAPQTIDVNFGTPGSLSGLTSISGDSALASTQDGFANGTLVSFSVSGGGVIEGIGDNGRRIDIAQLALANFRNPHGLTAEGNNFHSQSVASGEPQIGAPTTGGRGRIASGQLESSNVDIAFEFTRLIIAQRGFSANARTITVTDEILEELNSLIR